MKNTLKKAVVWLLIGVLMLGCTGCVSGKIYGKPLDEAEATDKTQGALFGTKIMEIMAEGTLDDLNQLGYHYGQADAETFEEFWEDWQELKPVYGQILSIPMQEGYQYGSELVFVFLANMEKGELQVSAMFTKDFELVQLFLYETAEEVLAKTVRPEGIVEEDIVVGEGTEYPLAGKITYPEGAKAGDNLPAAVLVCGEGGTNTMDMKAGNSYLYRDLAWGLAQMGIVTIRYDKRTLTYKDVWEDANVDPSLFSVEWEYTGDALMATELLRQLEFVNDDQVYYLGHSQSGVVAPRADETGHYAGMILLSTSPRPWYDVAYDQYINYGLIDQSSQSIYYLVSKCKMERDFLADGDYRDAKDEDLTENFPLNRPVAYWQDYLSYDYTAKFKELDKPILILQGEADYQIKADVDFAAWQEEMAGKSNVTLKSYEGLNHMFMRSWGCFAGHYKEYDIPNRASEEVIEDIGNWILGGGTLAQ